MKKTIISLTIIVVLSAVIFICIKRSNDHIECETKTEIAYGNNGEKIISEIHICKEKYNF